jgi:hypothetical protein
MKSRHVSYLILAALVVVIFVALKTSAKAEEPPATTTTEPGPEPVDRTLQGLNVDAWHRVAARYLGRVRSLQGALRYDPETSTAIGLAATVYGHGAELWRKARCESHYHRYSVNGDSGAAGLFQFLPSTWARTPFGRYSVFDPYANALAAGWMHSRGRGGEWVCH